jgi:hypothetical protein
MRGRYYLKHTINHTVDNQYKIKQLNENYKSMIKKNAVDYLRNTSDDVNKKVIYLKGLTHDTYRYGTKFKYDCNLNSSDISGIIRSICDDKLYYAYFGKTIDEYDSQNAIVIFIVVGLIIVIFVLLRACSA